MEDNAAYFGLVMAVSSSFCVAFSNAESFQSEVEVRTMAFSKEVN